MHAMSASASTDRPILVLSARGTPADRIAGLEDGADDYLPKPFSPAELVLRVRSILRRAEPEDPIGGPVRPVLVHGDLVLDRTIDVHIRRLRDKLDDDPAHPRYVMTVRGVGYRAAPARTVR